MKQKVFQVYKVEGYDDVGQIQLGELVSQRTNLEDAKEDVRILSSVSGRYLWREWWV